MAEDIRVVGLSEPGEPGGDYALPNESHIHTELYRSRPDAGAVVHAHPRDVVLAMDGADVGILRGHGVVTVGESVPQAILRALDLVELSHI
jgi:ribulose-5-phosphate 4-epimerase/fuculose-1-phosphate aldolase